MPDFTQQWSTQADWDAAQSRSRVVTRDLPGRTASDIELGFDPEYGVIASKAKRYYPLSESSGTVASEAIEGADGTVDSGVDLSVDGALGRTAAGFTDANPDYITLGNDAVFNSSGTLAIFALVDRYELDDRQVMFGHGADGNVGDWSFELRDNGRYYFYYRYATDPSQHDVFSFSDDPDTNVLYPIYLEYDEADDTARFYRSGGLVGKDTESENERPGTSLEGGIGRRPEADTRRFNGRIADAVVFTETLTSSEKDELFNTYDNGRLTTDAYHTDGEAVELTVNANVPVSTDLVATVYQDTSGDMTPDRSEQVTLDGGTNTYPLTEFISQGESYWVEVELSTADIAETPTASSITLGFDAAIGTVVQTGSDHVIDTTDFVIDTI